MANDIILEGLPNEKQLLFLKSQKKYVAYGGARGGGKSWAMRRKMVLRALYYPNSNGLILRRTFTELEKNHIIPLTRELYNIAKYNAQHKRFEFPNGSILFLGYCDKDDDVLQYQGAEFDAIGFEEATMFTEYQMQTIGLSLRTTNPHIRPCIYYTCNPGGVSHSYIKRLFIDKDYRDEEDPNDYDFIQATVYDNTVLMETMPDYVKSLKALPDEQRRAFLDGDWDVFAGQYFSEFRRAKHVVTPFDIPSWWERFISMDWGYNDPCAIYWHAVGPDSRVYTYREFYKNKTLASELADIIMSYDEPINYLVASPDMWARRGGGAGESIADTFMTAGIPLKKADNDRLNGWMRMREYLKDAPDGSPYWQIFSTCPNLIRTLPLLVHDENRVEDVSSKSEDHAPESCRYGLMSRFPISVEHTDREDNVYYDEEEQPNVVISAFD